MTLMKKSLSQNNYHNPARTVSLNLYAIAIWCPLCEKESNNELFFCVLALCSHTFCKKMVLYFLQDSALTWHWEGGAGVCSMGRR